MPGSRSIAELAQSPFIQMRNQMDTCQIVQALIFERILEHPLSLTVVANNTLNELNQAYLNIVLEYRENLRKYQAELAEHKKLGPMHRMFRRQGKRFNQELDVLLPRVHIVMQHITALYMDLLNASPEHEATNASDADLERSGAPAFRNPKWRNKMQAAVNQLSRPVQDESDDVGEMVGLALRLAEVPEETEIRIMRKLTGEFVPGMLHRWRAEKSDKVRESQQRKERQQFHGDAREVLSEEDMAASSLVTTNAVMQLNLGIDQFNMPDHLGIQAHRVA